MNATATTTDTFRAIFTCRNCKRVWALDYRIEGYDRYNLPYGSRELKQGEQAVREDAYSGRTYQIDMMGALRCPDCRCNLPKGGRVEGHYREDVKCGPRCLNAKGGDCDCQCGGKNHGMNHL